MIENYYNLYSQIVLARIARWRQNRTMFISLRSFVMPQRGGALLLTAAAFAAGLTAGAVIAPVTASRGGAIAAIQPQRAATLSRRCAAVIRPTWCA